MQIDQELSAVRSVSEPAPCVNTRPTSRQTPLPSASAPPQTHRNHLPSVAIDSRRTSIAVARDRKNASIDVVDSRHRVLAPDGGWGWMVAIASFMINFMVDGVCLSYGVFYVELRENFGDDSIAKIAFVGSLTTGMYMFIGPFVGGLVNRFGCRSLTIAGSVMAALFIGLSSLSPDVDVLLVTYSIMGGIGFGLMYLPAIIIVSFYFSRRRALATGFAICGSGIGMLVFSPIARYLLQWYGWRGGNFILAGFLLNGVACGLIFRPLTASRRDSTVSKTSTVPPGLWTPSRSASIAGSLHESMHSEKLYRPRGLIMNKIIDEKIRQRRNSTGSLDGIVITNDNRFIRLADSEMVAVHKRQGVTASLDVHVKPSASKSSGHAAPAAGRNTSATRQKKQQLQGLRYNPPIPQTRWTGPFISEIEETNSSSGNVTFTSDGSTKTSTETSLRTTDVGGDDLPRGDLEQRRHTVDVIAVDPPSRLSEDLEMNGEDMVAENNIRNRITVDDSGHLDDDDDPTERPLDRPDIFYSGSIVNIQQQVADEENPTSDQQRSPILDWTPQLDLAQDEGQDQIRRPKSQLTRDSCRQAICRFWREDCVTLFQQMIDVSLLRSPTFIVLCAAVVIPFFGIYTPFIYIVDHADHLGISKDDSILLLSVLGISNTVGRLVAGWLADKPVIDAVVFHNVCLIVAGTATCAVPLLITYELICIYLIVYGACTAVFITLRTIIAVELLGLRKLTSVFGMTSMFQGVAALVGTPLTGMLFDVSDSYALSFVVAGLLVAFGGFVGLPVRRIKRWEHERSKRQQHYVDVRRYQQTFTNERTAV